jgi:glycosyltransferase involved in cell wall biosynthesis
VPDWLSGLAAKMGNGVRWVGQVDHARRCELLAGAVALVNPARQVEPFGMVNIESLAVGCPVIGPTFGSFPEILEPREEAPLTAKNAKNAKGDLVLKNRNPSLRS